MLVISLIKKLYIGARLEMHERERERERERKKGRVKGQRLIKNGFTD